jgi:hypothetical protein
MASRIDVDPHYGPSPSGKPEQSDDRVHPAGVLERISLHGGPAAAWPVRASLTARAVDELLIERWLAVGLPDCCTAG